MYGSSTQLHYWTFQDETEILNLRMQVNQDFIQKYGANITKEEQVQFFLTFEEEQSIVRQYEVMLREFCRKFQDHRDGRIKMPFYVTATAQHYFKRFYLYNSVMDYHPKEILVTCVYLACKIEEFYVTMNDFVQNVCGNQRKAADVIRNNELQLTQDLQFHLIIHQPFRPVEGLLIDIKTRYSEFPEPERLREGVDQFLDRVHSTDVILLYAPSQIALAAVLQAASNLGENLDDYVTTILFNNDEVQLRIIIDAVKKIKRMVKSANIDSIDVSLRQELSAKLEKCRNQQNNPNSRQYRASYAEWDDDDDLPIASSEVDEMDTLGLERIVSPSA